MRRGLVEKLRLRCELAITVAFGAAQWVARWAARLPPPQPPAVQGLPFQDPLLRPLAGAPPARPASVCCSVRDDTSPHIYLHQIRSFKPYSVHHD